MSPLNLSGFIDPENVLILPDNGRNDRGVAVDVVDPASESRSAIRMILNHVSGQRAVNQRRGAPDVEHRTAIRAEFPGMCRVVVKSAVAQVWGAI